MVEAPHSAGGSALDAAPSDEPDHAKILIVDDVFDNRAILARRFQRRGYEVAEAENGARALELIAEQRFDMVLLDWMMPDMDGTEVLRRIRLEHSSVQLPVIMVTARTQSEDVVEALTLGANDYISKPVDFSVALARVLVQVGRKRAEDKVRNVNEALSRANEELEARVRDRTADLTKVNEQLRNANEQAQAARRVKDEFLANMSHELRTPLNGVLGMAQVLAMTPLTGAQQEIVDVIRSSGEALQSIVSDLLDMVDLSSGRIALTCDVSPLGEIVRAAASDAILQARGKGLGFNLDVSSAAEGPTEVDPDRLRQILDNLLSNAVKFTESGEVTLKVDRAGPGQETVVFEVRDTGMGFDEAVAARLFQRFEQADGTATRRFGGVGLGLSISRELAVQMGGSLTAEGRPGQGAAFRLTLPLPRHRERNAA